MSSYDKMPLPEIEKELEKIEVRLNEIKPAERKYVIFGELILSEQQSIEVTFLLKYRENLQKTLDWRNAQPQKQAANG